jgi:hypothetical protein
MVQFNKDEIRELVERGAEPRFANGEIVLDNPPADLDLLKTQVTADRRVRIVDKLKEVLDSPEGILILAVALTLRDGLDIERAEHGRAAISNAQLRQQVLDKVDSLI